MNARPNLDMDVLRTFVTGFELGSFAQAAARLGAARLGSARLGSARLNAIGDQPQSRKLETQIGKSIT